jgi:hypothetical protein
VQAFKVLLTKDVEKLLLKESLQIYIAADIQDKLNTSGFNILPGKTFVKLFSFGR